jgi:hypothetical protein
MKRCWRVEWISGQWSDAGGWNRSEEDEVRLETVLDEKRMMRGCKLKGMRGR